MTTEVSRDTEPGDAAAAGHDSAAPEEETIGRRTRKRKQLAEEEGNPEEEEAPGPSKKGAKASTTAAAAKPDAETSVTNINARSTRSTRKRSRTTEPHPAEELAAEGDDGPSENVPASKRTKRAKK